MHTELMLRHLAHLEPGLVDVELGWGTWKWLWYLDPGFGHLEWVLGHVELVSMYLKPQSRCPELGLKHLDLGLGPP